MKHLPTHIEREKRERERNRERENGKADTCSRAILESGNGDDSDGRSNSI